ncbi:unnamed protein product [Rotaria socialis]|uniref:SH2 domain-containing protein n=2 Tax=Rotaria socialis TaxID=392032 RepID=A0A818D1D3_9BILA|nr:unnamed protein product [Rotaria socialis]CAF4229085.1 unnamed protein product [Rotaria socialis]
MPLVSIFDRSLSTSSSFKQSTSVHTAQSCILSDQNVNGAAKENGCESSFAKHQPQQQQQQHHHHQHASDRTLTDFSNNNNNNQNNNSFSMSTATASCSSFQPHVVPEESYCSPWDLKTQEEKLKLLSQQRSVSSSNTITTLTDALLHPSNTNNRSTSSSSSSFNVNNNNNNNNPFHRTRSARTTSSTKKSLTISEPTPPLLPPLPPGGLIPPTPNLTCQCGSNNNTRNRSLNNTINNHPLNETLDPSLKKISYCLNAHVVRSGTDTSRSFVFAATSPTNERSQRVNTAPAKVDLSHLIDNRQEPSHITSQNSTISSLSTTSSSNESPSITDDSKPMSFEAALQRFKRLSSSTRSNNNNTSVSASSLPKPQITTNQESPTAYERPWDTLQTSLINSLSSPPSSSIHNRSRGSLQKTSSAEESKQHYPPFPIVSPTITTCRHSTCSPDEKHNSSNANTGEINKTNSRNLVPLASDIDTAIPIDRYFWYHYAMSRRAAESILQTRPPGSFLVRQSESGNQNDYSLSIKTPRSCMHMRICYSTGVYILGECSRPFPSVSRMLEYFSQTSVPIRGAAPIKLGTPVFRCEILSSSSSPPNNNHDCNEAHEELL